MVCILGSFRAEDRASQGRGRELSQLGENEYSHTYMKGLTEGGADG